MTATATMFGHEVFWDEPGQTWRYADDGALAHGWGGDPRPCPQCGDLPTTEGDDPCIRHIPGVYSACCGHGIENGVILWEALRPRVSDLRQYRESLGLSLAEVSTGTGLTKGFLSQLETGKASQPSLATARKLARFYDVPVDEMFPEDT